MTKTSLKKREREIIGGLFDSFAARWINPEAPLPPPTQLPRGLPNVLVTNIRSPPDIELTRILHQ